MNIITELIALAYGSGGEIYLSVKITGNCRYWAVHFTPKVKKVLDRKALTKQFKSDFGNLVAILGQLETNPTNDGIKSKVKTSYEKYLATKIQFIESFRSDAEAEIKRLRTEKKAEMDLIDAYEAKRGGGNSEGNKHKYMKYKLKYMKLKELLGL